jgi:formate/nitrite transporter
MIFELDAYSPHQIAEKVETIGVAKARLPKFAVFMLAVLAGGFIGLGALFSVIVVSDPALPFAVARVFGGVVFSLGLVLVVVAGAELFTGNNLMVMAWASRRISTLELARNWAIVYAGNAVGAAGLAAAVYLANHAHLNGGLVGAQYVAIAAAKVAQPPWEAFMDGVLCNLLVCLAVWISLAGRTVTDKILAIVFPISAFVAAGFEHSVANMYLIPLGIALAGEFGAGVPQAGALGWPGLLYNLVPVTLGNIVGGAGLVAAVYFLIYRVALRERARNAPTASAVDAPALTQSPTDTPSR